PNRSPPLLSFIYGIVKVPPPAAANCCARIFGYPFSCPFLNSALSLYPAAKESPSATYFVKTAEPGVTGTSSVVLLLSSLLHAAIIVKETKNNHLIFFFILMLLKNYFPI